MVKVKRPGTLGALAERANSLSCRLYPAKSAYALLPLQWVSNARVEIIIVHAEFIHFFEDLPGPLCPWPSGTAFDARHCRRQIVFENDLSDWAKSGPSAEHAENPSCCSKSREVSFGACILSSTDVFDIRLQYEA